MINSLASYIPVNSSIIKTSGWSIIEPITHANRYQLIQCLVQDEVITKRESNIKAFFNGLNMLKVGDLLLSHPDTMMSLFVFESEQLTAYSFMLLVESLRPESCDSKKSQTFEYFRQYVLHLEGL